MAAYYSALPNVPGAPSAWHVAEWHTPQTLDPSVMTQGDISEADPILGLPAYSWSTQNRDIRLSAYGTPGNYSYRLSDYNGTLTSDGGQNIFLEAAPTGPLPTFDHPINFDVDEALTSVGSGGIAQQVGNNFTVAFNAPGRPGYDPGLPTLSAFLQVPLSDSRGAPGAYFLAGAPTSVYNLTGQPYLPFHSATAFSNVSINVNAVLQDFISAYSKSGAAPSPTGFGNLANWSLTSTYVGSETADGGGLSLDVSHLRVTTDTSVAYSGTSGQAVTITAVPQASGSPASLVGYADASTAVQGSMPLAVSSGGPGYLQWQYIWSSSDAVALSTSVANVFLHGGAGNDALQVAHGQNVLDGGTGSNFLTGGDGNDTFFTDARSTAVVWNTIQNFHAGDAATLWGFVAGTSSYHWDTAISGAANAQGATLRGNIVGGTGRTGDGVDASITFAGLSVAQAQQLTITTGTAQAGSYLYITNPGV